MIKSSVLSLQIRSDYEAVKDIEYSLEGIGASQYPFHLFVVNPKNGQIRVTKVLDREEFAMYNVSASDSVSFSCSFLTLMSLSLSCDLMLRYLAAIMFVNAPDEVKI